MFLFRKKNPEEKAIDEALRRFVSRRDKERREKYLVNMRRAGEAYEKRLREERAREKKSREQAWFITMAGAPPLD